MRILFDRFDENKKRHAISVLPIRGDPGLSINSKNVSQLCFPFFSLPLH